VFQYYSKKSTLAKAVHDTRAYYGTEWNMEWKEKIGMEYGMAQVWNGRFDVWNGTNLPYSILAYFDMVLLKSGFSFS